MSHCPITGTPTPEDVLAEVRWQPPQVINEIKKRNPNWYLEQGASPTYVHQVLLDMQLSQVDQHLFESIQPSYPLDAQSTYGALPTPLRLRTDMRYSGRHVTIAIVDGGFYPHPDLTKPYNRIKAWVDASNGKLNVEEFKPDDDPSWLITGVRPSHQWRGMVNAIVCAGNGNKSHGLYRSLAPDADVVLVHVFDEEHGITKQSINRAFDWIKSNAKKFNIRIVALSALAHSADYIDLPSINPDIEGLSNQGIITVLPASHNDVRRTRFNSDAVIVGSIDDDKVPEPTDDNKIEDCDNSDCRPTVVVPSMRVVAPLLPGSDVEKEAKTLFEHRGVKETENRIKELNLITPFYRHQNGAHFSTSIVASLIANMLQSNPNLYPSEIRDVLMQSATHVKGATNARQGAGVTDSGMMIARASIKKRAVKTVVSPIIQQERVALFIFDPDARHVEVFGDWNDWQRSLEAHQIQPGLWRATAHDLAPGRYVYKFVVDGRWMDDPANPHKVHDTYTGFNSVVTIE